MLILLHFAFRDFSWQIWGNREGSKEERRGKRRRGLGRGREKEGGENEQKKHLLKSEGGSEGNGLFQLKQPSEVGATALFFWL